MLENNNFIKSVAVSGLTAGITKGITGKLNLNNPNTFTDKLKESLISNMTSTSIQSAINGDSFKKALKQQAINTIVMAAADYTANQIGSAYHTGQINKTEQLIFHALLGAAANGLTGNDMLSGAASAVIGELTGEYLKGKGYNKQNGSELAGLASGISNLFIGKLRDLDSDEISDNVYSGYRIGKNASENNAYDLRDMLDDVNTIRDARDTINGNDNGYYVENDDGTYKNDNYNETGDNYYNGVKNIDTLLALNNIALEVPEINLPDGWTLMDGGINYSAGSDGLKIEIDLSALSISDSYGFGSLGLGNVSFELSFDPKNFDISAGVKASVVKGSVEIQGIDGTSIIIEGSLGGAGIDVSNKGFKVNNGASIEISIKNSNKKD